MTSVGEVKFEVIFPNIIEFYLNFRPSWVKVFGTKYVKGSIIVADLHYGNPIFGEIIHVLVGDGTALISDYNLVKVREFYF